MCPNLVCNLSRDQADSVWPQEAAINLAVSVDCLAGPRRPPSPGKQRHTRIRKDILSGRALAVTSQELVKGKPSMYTVRTPGPDAQPFSAPARGIRGSPRIYTVVQVPPTPSMPLT